MARFTPQLDFQPADKGSYMATAVGWTFFVDHDPDADQWTAFAYPDGSDEPRYRAAKSREHGESLCQAAIVGGFSAWHCDG